MIFINNNVTGPNLGDEKYPERMSDIVLVLTKIFLVVILITGLYFVEGSKLFPDMIPFDTDVPYFLVIVVLSFILITPYVLKTKTFRISADDHYLYYRQFNKSIKYEIKKCYFFYRKQRGKHYLCVVDDNGTFYALKCPNTFRRSMESFITVFLTPNMMGSGLCDFEVNHIGRKIINILNIMKKIIIYTFLFGAIAVIDNYIEYGNVISAILYISWLIYLFVIKVFTYNYLDKTVSLHYFIFNNTYFYVENRKIEIDTLSRIILKHDNKYRIMVMRDSNSNYTELFSIDYGKVKETIADFEKDLNVVLNAYPRIIRG